MVDHVRNRPPGEDRPGGVVRIFVHEPELLGAVPDATAEALRERTLVRTVRLDPGPLRAPLLAADPGDVGFVVLRGLLIHRVQVAGRSASEIVGTSDVVVHAAHEAEVDAADDAARWRACTTAMLAVLDRRFAHAMAADPTILVALLRRLAARPRRLAQQLALARLPRMEDRLLALLWLLARRFGTADEYGARLVLPVTQETLAELTGARRQAVNAALQRLRERGAIVWERGGRWQLLGPAPRFAG